MSTGIALGRAASSPARGRAPARLALKIALRDLRGGVRGFRVFLACLAIGVGAIASVLSISRALEEGVASEGRLILGGDVALSQVHVPAAAGDRAFMEHYGQVSETAGLRAMARAGGSVPALVEIKAADDAYPLTGAVGLDPAMTLGEALAEHDGIHGIATGPELLSRLGLEPADLIAIGEATYRISAAIVSEPDRLAEGFAFGPRVLMSLDGLKASGLIQPGSLIRWTYRIALPSEAAASDFETLADAAEARLEPDGWTLRTRERANPGIDRFMERLTLYLSLVGLTALVVGGVGIANAVSAYLGDKARIIAMLKCLGAPAALVFRVYFIEVMILAALGVAAGLAVGAAAPFLIEALAGDLVPLPIRPGLYGEPLAFAAACGFATTAAFALWPLGRAQEIAPASLFRDLVAPSGIWPRRTILAAIVASAVLLAALVIVSADDRWFASIYVAGAAASFAVLIGLGRGLMWAMRRAPRPRNAALRLAIASLSRPGAATPGVVLSLGLGLTLLVMIGLIDRNLQREIESELPQKAPSFFFLDIPREEAGRFDATVMETPGIHSINRVPMLRGHIAALNGVPSGEIEPAGDGWVLRGDRGITFAGEMPEGTKIVSGEWWPADYEGEQLVSFADEPAKGLGLKVGDTIKVNVLGREIEARIASTRDVNWRTLNVNFVMIFSPGPITAAPHAWLASVAMDEAGEGDLVRRMADVLPGVTAVRVRDALEAVGELLGNLMLAIRGAGVIAIVTGALVLGGAIAAGRRARIYDAVVLKTFGATRRQILTAYLAEFAVLGLLTALFAVVAGSIAAYFVLTEAMDVDFTLPAGVVLAVVALGMTASVAVGFAGTFRALGAKAAPILRSP